MKTLCLVMIVKNEGRNMRRCLQHVKHHIDCFVICDTGSTDDTVEVIKEELRGIPGDVVYHKWVDFGHNRTLALQEAKGRADYFILCDADEVLHFSPTFNKNELDKDCYYIRYANGSLDYSFIGIVKGSHDWKYVGVTHEYIDCDKVIFNRGELKDVWLVDYGDGGSRGNKFQRDIDLLTQGLKDEPENTRYMFYLANTYMWTGEYHRAIDWYRRRIQSGGWIEEVTCSYEYQGICLKKLDRTWEAVGVWWNGWKHNPSRAECLYRAAETHLELGGTSTARELLLKAKNIPYPHNDVLFINRDIYNYWIDYQLMMCPTIVSSDWATITT